VLYTRKVDKYKGLILSNLRVSYLGAHRDHREGALVRVLGKEVWMRILIATNFLKKRAKSRCYTILEFGLISRVLARLRQLFLTLCEMSHQ
jgi:hypothetical protein